MKLAINGINCGALMSATEPPTEKIREVGESAEAADGSTVITRLTKKKDLTFRTVLLTHAQAHAWVSLLTGEGEAWSFDSTLYGSKGTGPSSSTNTTQDSGAWKYGTGRLSVGATTGTITWSSVTVNEFGAQVGWHVMIWRFESAAWHHYQVRSDGAKWLDGVRNDAATTTWLTVSAGNVTIANTTGAAVYYDDLVVLPFAVLDDWPAQIYAAAVAYGAVPYLNATGDLVPEQTTRVVMGRAEDASFKLTGAGLLKSLSVELVAK